MLDHARHPLESTWDESLHVEVVPERDAVRVCPVGSLDLATVPMLDAQLEELRGAGFTAVVVDLRRLTFVDSTGLRLLLRWTAAAREDGIDLGIVPGTPPVQRVFALTGTSGLLPFVTAG